MDWEVGDNGHDEKDICHKGKKERRKGDRW